MNVGSPIPDERWHQIPPEAQAVISALIQHYEKRLGEFEAGLNQNSTNSSKPLPSEPLALKRAPPKMPSTKKPMAARTCQDSA
jgi:uncharacterized protein DUF6444